MRYHEFSSLNNRNRQLEQEPENIEAAEAARATERLTALIQRIRAAFKARAYGDATLLE
jgi:hypothetical protein